MKNIIMILGLLFITTTAFALPGDPPLWGGDCGPDRKVNIKNPDCPIPISLAHKMIEEQGDKIFSRGVAPYVEIDPATGKEAFRQKYRPQMEAAKRDAEEWVRRAKDKVEKYMENDPCPDGLGLIIRQKYLDLIW